MDFYYSRCNMMIFSHDFFTTGIYYLQKSLYTAKIDILYYNILENENNDFFHRLVGLWKYGFLLLPLILVILVMISYTIGIYYLQKSLYTVKLDIL